MKKISIMLLAALMLFAFVACDDKTPAPEAATAEEISLVADYINALEQADIKSDLAAAYTAAGTEQENGLTVAEAQGEDKNVVVTFKNYTNGVGNSQSGLSEVKIVSGKVTLSLYDGETQVTGDKLASDADGYKIVVENVKFTAKDKTAVTLSFTAEGDIDTQHVIKYPAAADVTGLKVLFGETEKAASWADIDAKITK